MGPLMLYLKVRVRVGRADKSRADNVPFFLTSCVSPPPLSPSAGAGDGVAGDHLDDVLPQHLVVARPLHDPGAR